MSDLKLEDLSRATDPNEYNRVLSKKIDEIESSCTNVKANPLITSLPMVTTPSFI